MRSIRRKRTVTDFAYHGDGVQDGQCLYAVWNAMQQEFEQCNEKPTSNVQDVMFCKEHAKSVMAMLEQFGQAGR